MHIAHKNGYHHLNVMNTIAINGGDKKPSLKETIINH